MANSNTYKVTLVTGPISYNIKNVQFKRGIPVTVSDMDILNKLLLDSNFSCIGNDPKPLPKTFTAPRKSVDESFEDDEDEDDDEEDDDSDEPPLTLNFLKKQRRDELVRLAQKNGIDINTKSSKAMIIDAILSEFS